jgi:hypothetical protein
MKKWIALTFLFSLQVVFLNAQTTKQVWEEYTLNDPFANSINPENAFVYSTLLGKPKWRAYDDTNKEIN